MKNGLLIIALVILGAFIIEYSAGSVLFGVYIIGLVFVFPSVLNLIDGAYIRGFLGLALGLILLYVWVKGSGNPYQMAVILENMGFERY